MLWGSAVLGGNCEDTKVDQYSCSPEAQSKIGEFEAQLNMAKTTIYSSLILQRD